MDKLLVCFLLTILYISYVYSTVTSCISCHSETGSDRLCEQDPDQLLPVQCQEDQECGGVEACCVVFVDMYFYGKNITSSE